MAYSNRGLTVKDVAQDGGVATFRYVDNSAEDARAMLDTDGFFTDGADFGMKPGDIVFVQRRGIDPVDVHRVIAVTGRAVTTRYLLTTVAEMVGLSSAFRSIMPKIIPLSISQVAYDALSVKDPNTLYLIPGA